MSKKEVGKICIFAVLVFIGLLLFFTAINPLVVYDVDDWLYISQLRKPIPMIHAWNPIKVFPETAMPFISYLSAWVINPIIDNYCKSLTIGHGIFTSVILTIYFVQFVILFYKRKFTSLDGSIKYGCFFVLLHFISNILKGNNNLFILNTLNLTCIYNYMLPTILNAIAVMHFMSYGGVKNWFKKSNVLHKIVVVLWLYFAINSNLFSSVVLATYVGTELLLNLIPAIKEKRFNLKEYCADNWCNLLIIFVWLCSNILETTGGRADSIHKNVLLNLPMSFVYFIVGMVTMNIFLNIMNCMVFVSWFKEHNKKLSSTAIRFIYYIGLLVAYLLLLCATSEPSYLALPHVDLAIFFYLIIAMIACLNELIKSNERFRKIPLILLGTLALLLIFPGRLFAPYNYSLISYNQCEALMNDVIDQFKAAEAAGQSEVVLEIPEYDEGGNWPLSTDLIGERYSNAFYKHKITKSYITVKDIVVTEEKTKEFDIPKVRNLLKFK